MEVLDLYNLTEKEKIDIIDYKWSKAKARIFEENNEYSIGIDYSKIANSIEEKEILAEELGFIGCVIVILLFAIFIWRGILIAIKSPDMFGSLLATGITTLIGIQVIINIGVVTSSIPNTGMPLPFFSYGGTALLILLSSCGILLNISRAGTKV